MHEAERYIGLMSGTSLDGVDAALVEFSPTGIPHLLRSAYLPYDDALRARLLALHTPQADELHRAQSLGNELAALYAQASRSALGDTPTQTVRAIACHGQTVRHRPECGYSLQIGNAALLAELTGLPVVSDFRSRDIAAGGQGAPLVPAFHAAVLAHPRQHRVIANIGGIANITDLPPQKDVRGWDTGPGNLLMDAWIQRHLGQPYDQHGDWAAQGTPQPALLERLLAHPYLSAPPPKSAGREQFNLDWLDRELASLPRLPTPADVQATLLELTARSLADAVRGACAGSQHLAVCGGGAHNARLLARLHVLLPRIEVVTSAAHGIDPDWMEAIAFAWLARQTLHGANGNLPAVTGARGPRVLGAIHPA